MEELVTQEQLNQVLQPRRSEVGEWVTTTTKVAQAYGAKPDTIYKLKRRNATGLKRDVHYIQESHSSVIWWTKVGVAKLGTFLTTPKARAITDMIATMSVTGNVVKQAETAPALKLEQELELLRARQDEIAEMLKQLVEKETTAVDNMNLMLAEQGERRRFTSNPDCAVVALSQVRKDLYRTVEAAVYYTCQEHGYKPNKSDYQSAWERLYREFKYKYGIILKDRAKGDILDWATEHKIAPLPNGLNLVMESDEKDSSNILRLLYKLAHELRENGQLFQFREPVSAKPAEQPATVAAIPEPDILREWVAVRGKQTGTDTWYNMAILLELRDGKPVKVVTDYPGYTFDLDSIQYWDDITSVQALWPVAVSRLREAGISDEVINKLIPSDNVSMFSVGAMKTIVKECLARNNA